MGVLGLVHGYLEHFCRQAFCYVERALEHQLTLLKEIPQQITGAVFWLWLLLCRPTLNLARLFHLYCGHIAKPERA